MKEDLTIYVKKFQNGLITKRVFLNKINPIILKIPCYLGYKSTDIKHEFYAYIISKIDKIISLYKVIPNISFKTWFNIVLKREFYRYINKINKYNEFESIHINEIKNNYLLHYQETSILSPAFVPFTRIPTRGFLDTPVPICTSATLLPLTEKFIV